MFVVWQAGAGRFMIARRKPIERRSRPRKRRKGTKAALAREADKLWSLLVRRPGLCEICGSRFRLQGAHGFSRRYRNTRWLLINGFCLCSGCHVYFTHRDLEWQDFLRRSWGESVYDELRRLALRTTAPDVAAALAKLREEA